MKFLATYYQFETYTQKFCLNTCYQKYVLDKCNCYDMRLSFSKPFPFKGCTKSTDLKCLLQVYFSFYETNENNACYSQCRIECTETWLNIDTSYSVYPNEWYSNLVLNQTNLKESLNESMLAITVSYDRMAYLMTSETPKWSVEFFLALIGGNLGLFLGSSLMCLIELLELVFHCIYIGVHRYWHRKKTNKIHLMNIQSIKTKNNNADDSINNKF